MIQAIPDKGLDTDDGRLIAWTDPVGRLGLYAFFLFFQLNTTVAYIGLLLIVLVFVFQWKLWMPVLKHEPVVYLVLVIALYILGYSIVSAQEFPETSDTQWSAAYNFMHCLLFIPVAWQVNREANNLNRMLLILASGVMIRIMVNLDWRNLYNLFEWERTGFGYSEIVFALIVAIVSLGFLLLAPRITEPPAPARTGVRVARFCLWLLSLAIFLEAMVLNQTRTAWIAAAIVFPPALVVRYRGWLQNRAFRSAGGLAVLAVVIVTGAAFIGKNSAAVIRRMQAEPEAIQQIMRGDMEKAQSISIGARLKMWRTGLQKWSERPLFGWGPGTTELIIRQSADPLLTLYYHLHNLYLEVLVRLGLLGGALLGTLAGLLLRGVWKAGQQGYVPGDYACFLFAGWGFFAIYMFFDFQLFKYAWRNYCVIWAALTYAIRIGYIRQCPVKLT